ncbi:Mpo1 family 2-hydroxy fatty acid dioxygenase [Aeromonas hydrophila]|uniref:Mpo1 family 2-hydroxy fatty acid dioxygenase n=1 Tax=Aeromonas hydrophila TaxID=644 RepID=UPI002B0582D9|nr:Mpo1-like protein [Aeromonas hydrophila]
MKGIEEWFELYGQSHRHPVNVAIHKLAVPGIYLCALALLWCLPAGPLPSSLNWAALVAIPVLAFYLRLSFALFVGMTVLTALGLVICHSWQGPLLWPALFAFVLLWIAQFVGHKIEGKRPSFLADLQFLLIGPAWVLASLYRRLGILY